MFPSIRSQPDDRQLFESMWRYQQLARSLERELRTEKELHSITRSSLSTMERDHTNLRLQISSIRQKQAKKSVSTHSI